MRKYTIYNKAEYSFIMKYCEQNRMRTRCVRGESYTILSKKKLYTFELFWIRSFLDKHCYLSVWKTNIFRRFDHGLSFNILVNDWTYTESCMDIRTKKIIGVA